MRMFSWCGCVYNRNTLNIAPIAVLHGLVSVAKLSTHPHGLVSVAKLCTNPHGMTGLVMLSLHKSSWYDCIYNCNTIHIAPIAVLHGLVSSLDLHKFSWYV